jgi:hypothetical protein
VRLPSVSDPKAVKHFYSRMLAMKAKQRVEQYTESRTLRAALRIEREKDRWFLGVPHYWAVYYHDGRSAAAGVRCRWLIWYPNPANDPRHRGNYPVRAQQILSLRDLGWSWERVLEDVRAGIAVMADLSPRSGRPVRGKYFFIKGMRRFFATGGKERIAAFKRLLKSEIPMLYEKRTRKVRVYV